MNEVRRRFVSNIFFFILSLLALFIIYKLIFKQFRTQRPRRVFIPLRSENIKKIELKNGLTALLYKYCASPKVFIQLTFHVGSSAEQMGKKGIAHVLEHMIFKSNIPTIARKYGAQYNAFTTPDVTSYYFEVDKNNWKPFFRILSHSMKHLHFSQLELKTEIKTVMHELNKVTHNHKLMMMLKALSLLYPAHHPYHCPVIGYKNNLKNITHEDLKAFHQQFYHPANATLLVVGDIDFASVEKAIKKYFGQLEQKNTPREKQLPQINKTITHQTKWFKKNAKYLLGLYWHIPGYNNPHSLLSSAVAALMGKGPNSRLHKALVDTHKVATFVKAYAIRFQKDGMFFIYAKPLEGKSQKCKQIIIDEIKKALRDGFSQEELDRLLLTKQAHFYEKHNHFKKLAKSWMKHYQASTNELEFFQHINLYHHINSAQLQKFTAQWLDPFFTNYIEILPTPQTLKKINKKMISHNWSPDTDVQTDVQLEPKTDNKENNHIVQSFPKPKPLSFFPQQPQTITLKNGLNIYLQENKSLPLFSLHCQFKQAYYFKSSLEGLAIKLMMSMLLEQSKYYNKTNNLTFFENHGISVRFFTSGGSLQGLNYSIRPAIKRFLHILQRPRFSHRALKKWKKIYSAKIAQRKKNDVAWGERILKSLIFSKHPYGWSFEKGLKYFEQLTVKDLNQLHKTYVNPANMTLSLVGDFDSDEIQNTLTKFLESWKNKQIKEMRLPEQMFEPGLKIDKKTHNDQVVLFFGQPSELSINHQDKLPLTLLNFITFKSLGSRLYQLREDHGLFYSATGGWARHAIKKDGYDFIKTTVNPSQVEHAENLIHDLFEKLTHKGITQEELGEAKQWYRKKIIDRFSKNQTCAHTWCNLANFDLPIDHFTQNLKRLENLSLTKMNNLCKKYLHTNKMARVRIGKMTNT